MLLLVGLLIYVRRYNYIAIFQVFLSKICLVTQYVWQQVKSDHSFKIKQQCAVTS